MNRFIENIRAFVELGNIIKERKNSTYSAMIEEVVCSQSVKNHWFMPVFIHYALDAIAFMLNEENLGKLPEKYATVKSADFDKRETIAVISPGNIPLAGFHDFFSVLVSGNHYQGKLSEHDNLLLPMIAKILTEIQPQLAERISFVNRIEKFDKVIATGSNNSSRYFEYYFGQYSHILRKNRNSLAILSGSETEKELEGLFHDIFLYFGLGCRSVSHLFLPKGYTFDQMFAVFERLGKEIAMHHHYLNNLEYQKTVHLMNAIPFQDSGIALFVEDKRIASPISVIHYQYYSSEEEIKTYLEAEKENLQCVVGGNSQLFGNAIPFGSAQQPAIDDFPDGVDVIKWAITA